MSSSQTSTPPLWVPLFLGLGILSFSFSPIFVRWAGETDPYFLAAGRLGVAWALLWPFWLRNGTSLRILKREKGVEPWAIILSGALLGAHLVLFITSIQFTSVASATVLVTMHPILFIVLESVIFRHPFGWRTWLGVITALLGTIILALGSESDSLALSQGQPLLGNILAFSAAILFAFYFLIGRSVRQKSTWIDYVFYVYGAAFITASLLFVFLADSYSGFGGIAWLMVALLAIGPTILGHGSLNFAVRYYSATALSTLILSEAVLATLFAFVLFQEVPSALTVGGMVIIMGGISLTWSARSST
ncbi:MAG: DMT family transporter [Balneolaceae bacterium]|nr:DMT family transporter [Balneolaceae bacterium]